MALVEWLKIQVVLLSFMVIGHYFQKRLLLSYLYLISSRNA